MELRLAQEKDIPQLCVLLDALFSQEPEMAPDLALQTKGLQMIISNPELGEIIVAEESGQILGMVNLLYTISTALGGRVAIIDDLVVAPDGRGKGTGTKLMNHAAAWAKEKDCKRITLHTDHDNHAAQYLYEKSGYERSSMLIYRTMLD